MTAERRSGMDQPFYDWSPIVSRPPLAWPAGARLALWVVVYFEDWELEPPTDSYRAPGVHGTWWTHFPDLRTYTYREYGHRVGIFRVMELLDRYGLRATVASNAAACARFPFVVQECLARGWEFIGHGSHATRMITSRMSEADERAVIGESIAAIERADRPAADWMAGPGFRRVTADPWPVGGRGSRLCLRLAQRRPAVHDRRGSAARLSALSHRMG